MAKTKDTPLTGRPPREDGLLEVAELGVQDVAARGAHHIAVTFIEDLPAEIASALGAHRFVLEGEEQVRTLAGDVTGATIVVHDETVPATFAALADAAGKNLRFLRVP